jgi:hypothetical protein
LARTSVALPWLALVKVQSQALARLKAAARLARLLVERLVPALVLLQLPLQLFWVPLVGGLVNTCRPA